MAKKFNEFVTNIPMGMAIILCLTLGLAPFNPPHIAEKLILLINGKVLMPVDWFDLFLHGGPWLVLFLKIILLKDKKAGRFNAEK